MPDYYEKPMYLLHHGYMDTCYTIQILNLVIQALPPPPVFVRLRSLAIHPHIPSFSSPIKSERVLVRGGVCLERWGIEEGVVSVWHSKWWDVTARVGRGMKCAPRASAYLVKSVIVNDHTIPAETDAGLWNNKTRSCNLEKLPNTSII